MPQGLILGDSHTYTTATIGIKMNSGSTGIIVKVVAQEKSMDKL